MNMNDRVKNISNREDLARFVEEMSKALKNGERWENRDLKSFLEAMAAWIEDMDGYFENQGEPCPTSPSWKTFAQILAASTVYE